MDDAGNKEQQPSAGLQPDGKKRSFGTPFPPGVSGNPSGRPKGAKSITPVLRATIADDDIAAIVRNLIEDAKSRPQLRTITTKNGSYEAYDANEVKMYLDARSTILDRLDGKLSLASGLDGGAVSEIIVRYDKQASHAAD